MATFFLGLFWIIKKILYTQISPLLGVFFIYLGGFLFFLILSLLHRPEWHFDASFKKGVILALIGGIVIASFDFLSVLIFKRGENLSVIPASISGGAILIAAFFGPFLLHESITFWQILGVLAIIFGIFLLTR